MPDQDLLQRYNYDAFTPDKFEPWMRFHESPPLGVAAPDFPLRSLETRESVALSALWGAHRFTIVEFGSFT